MCLVCRPEEAAEWPTVPDHLEHLLNRQPVEEVLEVEALPHRPLVGLAVVAEVALQVAVHVVLECVVLHRIAVSVICLAMAV